MLHFSNSLLIGILLHPLMSSIAWGKVTVSVGRSMSIEKLDVTERSLIPTPKKPELHPLSTNDSMKTLDPIGDPR